MNTGYSRVQSSEWHRLIAHVHCQPDPKSQIYRVLYRFWTRPLKKGSDSRSNVGQRKITVLRKSRDDINHVCVSLGRCLGQRSQLPEKVELEAAHLGIIVIQIRLVFVEIPARKRVLPQAFEDKYSFVEIQRLTKRKIQRVLWRYTASHWEGFLYGLASAPRSMVTGKV